MKVDYGNDPRCLGDLSAERQAVLLDWIREVLTPAPSVFRRNSYTMKHDFEREPEGFYITNGMFKGAMLVAGYRPTDPQALNWRFRVKPVRELDAWEKDKLRLTGRGWLIRDRWRVRGYVVALRSQHRRIQEYDRVCQREARTKLLMLRGAKVAEIILDTYPGGYRLTDAAVDESAGLFDRLNPSGRNWSITNKCLAVIRRVPLWRAEEVAVALVKIAHGCAPGASGGGESGHASTRENPPRY